MSVSSSGSDRSRSIEGEFASGAHRAQSTSTSRLARASSAWVWMNRSPRLRSSNRRHGPSTFSWIARHVNTRRSLRLWPGPVQIAGDAAEIPW